jgi:threonine/homoserine/homoserine lactone efflux protein
MEIIEPIWKGVATGILFTLTFGAVFFSLIQASVKRGLKKAVFIAAGVVMSDAFFIAAAVLGTTFISDEMKKYDLQIRGVGFVFLLFLGIRSIIKKEKDHREDSTISDKRNIIYLAKGIMLNSINPMILISWMGVTTYVKTVGNFGLDQVILFYLVVLATMFFTMFGICYFAGKLRNVLSPENMHRLNVGSGIVFIIFAIVIMWPVFGLGTF